MRPPRQLAASAAWLKSGAALPMMLVLKSSVGIALLPGRLPIADKLSWAATGEISEILQKHPIVLDGAILNGNSIIGVELGTLADTVDEKRQWYLKLTLPNNQVITAKKKYMTQNKGAPFEENCCSETRISINTGYGGIAASFVKMAGWQNAHSHPLQENYTVERGTAVIAVWDDNARLALYPLKAGDEFTIAPGAEHNVWVSEGCEIHTMQHSPHGFDHNRDPDKDWRPAKKLDEATKSLSSNTLKDIFRDSQRTGVFVVNGTVIAFTVNRLPTLGEWIGVLRDGKNTLRPAGRQSGFTGRRLKPRRPPKDLSGPRRTISSTR